MERSFGKGCERRGLRLVHYSLQDDHAHLIVEASGREALGARLARAVNRVFGRRGPVLADRYHLRVLRSPRQVRAALRYVLLNTRKHARRRKGDGDRDRLVDPASSGFWFDGWRGEPQAEAAWFERWQALPPPVAKPRTWLIAKGWRRHGLIDLVEAPRR